MEMDWDLGIANKAGQGFDRHAGIPKRVIFIIPLSAYSARSLCKTFAPSR